MLFGVLKPNRVVTDVEKVFISVAHERGHQAYVFSAKDIDFESRKINGITLVNNLVQERTFEFPHIIQNRLAVKTEDVEAYSKLSEIIPFTSHRVGTKQQVYDILKQEPALKKYLIEVKKITEFTELLAYVQQHHKVIAKPSASNQGKGIFSFEMAQTGYVVRHLDQLRHCNEVEFADIFKAELHNGVGFSMSPFIISETHLGQSTVFRLHMTRGAEGKWKKIKFFPYVNLNKDIDITNGMQGALITTRETLFLEQYYPQAHTKISKEIEQLFRVFSKHINGLFAWPLDALGLDLGITQSGDIYVYELNAGPGVGFMAYPVACEQVLYYEWLAQHAQPPYKNNYLPIHLAKKQVIH